MNSIKYLLATSLMVGLGNQAMAAATPEQAAQLGKTLTEFGAEKAGNADGSIPAYTGGGVGTLPRGFVAGSGRYPDPYAAEKPVVSVDAKNIAQHAAFLSDGVKALMQRFPTYRVDVFPTHRTMGYPDWVLKNTVKNATSAKLIGKIMGDGVEGAYGGIPFPIPKNGYEVLWNHQLRWQGAFFRVNHHGYLVDAAGSRSLLYSADTKQAFPYYNSQATKLEGNYFNYLHGVMSAPAAMSGLQNLLLASINYSEKDGIAWIYLPSLRRTRLAPEAKYDTPASMNSGLSTYDEVGIFSGRPDRFDFKLIGKKEMYVPYNNYKANNTAITELMPNGSRHLNPDHVRWEKHRVWVVEQQLKPGQRHIYKRRILYFDEDTWMLIMGDGFDQSDKLYRASFALPVIPYDKPIANGTFTAYYDLATNKYGVQGWQGPDASSIIEVSEKMPKLSDYTPESLTRRGVR